MTTYQLYNGDAIKVLAGLKPMRKALLLTDPPYGEHITKKANKYGKATHASRKASGECWDDQIVNPAWIAQAMKVTADQIIFGGNYYLDVLPATRCFIVWDKRGDLPDVPFTPVEWAWTSFSKQPVKYTILRHGFIKDGNDPDTGHASQKPVKLMEQIIRDFAKPGTVIVDPFMGSGSTGVAAVRLGFDFIGVEIDPHWYRVAEQRIQNANGEFIQTDMEQAHGQMFLFG